jgi:hypothetical protein
MKALAIYLRLYQTCGSKALAAVRKNLWTVLLPMGLWLVLLLAAPLAGAFGILSGLVMSLVLAALLSVYLYFVGELVSFSRVRPSELGLSVRAYLWPIVNLLFVVFIVRLVLSLLLQRVPGSGWIFLALYLAAFVILNPAAEMIYQRGTHGGLETAQQSLRFIRDNWLEWFVPNVLIGALLFGVASFITALPTPAMLLGGFLLAALFHVAMVFRGHLFKALAGTSHRQRMFQYRTASSMP